MLADSVGALALFPRCGKPYRRPVGVHHRLALGLAVFGCRRALVGAPNRALHYVSILDDGWISAGVELDSGLCDQREDHVRSLGPWILLFLGLLRGELHRLVGLVLPIGPGVFVDIKLEEDELTKRNNNRRRIVFLQIHFVDLADEDLLDWDILAAAIGSVIDWRLLRVVRR